MNEFRQTVRPAEVYAALAKFRAPTCTSLELDVQIPSSLAELDLDPQELGFLLSSNGRA